MTGPSSPPDLCPVSLDATDPPLLADSEVTRGHDVAPLREDGGLQSEPLGIEELLHGRSRQRQRRSIECQGNGQGVDGGLRVLAAGRGVDRSMSAMRMTCQSSWQK